MTTKEIYDTADDLIKTICHLVQKELKSITDPRDRLILLYLVSSELPRELSEENAKTFNEL